MFILPVLIMGWKIVCQVLYGCMNYLMELTVIILMKILELHFVFQERSPNLTVIMLHDVYGAVKET